MLFLCFLLGASLQRSLNEKGFEIEVSKLLENSEYDDGWDLVDVLNDESKK